MVELEDSLEAEGHPCINGCFNWMIPSFYMGKMVVRTKISFKTACLEFQVKEDIDRCNQNY